MGDTAFAGGSTQDADHRAIFGEGLGGDEGERYLDGGLLPRFDRYILRIEGAEGRVSDNGMPYVHAAVRVEEGPAGTKGRTLFPDLFLKVNRTFTRDGEEITLSDEDWQKAVDRTKKRKNRVGRVFGLNFDLRSFEEADVRAYGAQFGGTNGQGLVFIGAVGMQKARGTYDAKNILIWESIAAPTDPAKDAKGMPTGKDAITDAREKIAAFDAKAAKGGGRKGATGTKIDPKTLLNI